MAEKVFFIRYRKYIISFAVMVTVMMLLPLRQARINPDLMEYLPDDIESKVNLDMLEEVFGHYDPVIIFFESSDILREPTLKRIREINNSFNSLAEFEEVISIYESKYIRGEQGAMFVDPVIRRIPATEEQREQLRREIMDNPLAWKLLVSEDFRYTIMILNPSEDVDDAEVFGLIGKVLEEFPGDERVYFSGLPFLRNEIQILAARDLSLLFPLGMVIMLVFLFLSFRELRSVLLPFSVVCMSTVAAMGLMPLMGWDFSIIAVLVPVMMIAVANNYGVHIVSRYQEIYAGNPEMDVKDIVNSVMANLRRPIILTALTTIFGILGLAAHVMLPAGQMGIVSAAGIAFALILSLLYIPAVMSMLNKGKIHKSYVGEKNSPVDRFLLWSGRITTGRPKLTVMLFLIFLLVAGAGISRLNVSINMEEMMPSSHPLRISTGIANQHFGGTKYISVMFEGDIRDPEVMQTMDRFGKELSQVRGVGSVTSIATVIREISRALNDPGDEFYDVIPDDRTAIAQYLELYNMSGDPEDLERLVDFDFTKAILNVQFRAEDIREFRRITGVVDEMVEGSPHAVLQAGQSLIEKEMSMLIVAGQVRSLLFALLAIIVLLGLIFRSVYAGLMGAIPLVFTLICNFGLMGWAGFDLDIATSLLSSIAVGIGVDYTIHIFWRLKQELAAGRGYSEAVRLSLATTGRGIAINAFSVMLGFAVLFFSGLVILKTFAFLIIFSLLLCLLCALLLVPALSLMFKPAFLENIRSINMKRDN